MMSLWDALRMNMMISYQELVRTFPITWGLLTANRGEFLVADYYPGDRDGLQPFIPISPHHAFFANVTDRHISVQQVRELNRASVASSKNYYFCRSLDNCPL